MGWIGERFVAAASTRSSAGTRAHGGCRRTRERLWSLVEGELPEEEGTEVEAHLAAIEYLRNGGETRPFNLGVGRGYSVQEVVDAVRRVTGREFEVITEGRRPGDPAQLVANPSLAMQTFGWKPRYGDIDTIVAHAWAWQLKSMNS